MPHPTPQVILPGQGPIALGPDMSRSVLKLVSPQTNALLSLTEYHAPPAGGPPLHMHTLEDETFYILEGEVTFYVGGNIIKATPGTTVFAPRHTPHTFKNCITQWAKFIMVVTPPDNFERFYARISAKHANGSDPTPDEVIARIGQFAPEHGLQIMGPNPL
ncbi:MAG: cupin domain-containing protein [Phycisphaerales bacterium]